MDYDDMDGMSGDERCQFLAGRCRANEQYLARLIEALRECSPRIQSLADELKNPELQEELDNETEDFELRGFLASTTAIGHHLAP